MLHQRAAELRGLGRATRRDDRRAVPGEAGHRAQGIAAGGIQDRVDAVGEDGPGAVGDAVAVDHEDGPERLGELALVLVGRVDDGDVTVPRDLRPGRSDPTADPVDGSVCPGLRASCVEGRWACPAAWRHAARRNGSSSRPG